MKITMRRKIPAPGFAGRVYLLQIVCFILAVCNKTLRAAWADYHF